MKKTLWTSIIISALLVSLSMLSSCAPEKPEAAEIKVNSIICGMCVQTVEEVITGVEGVKMVKVDLEAKIVSIEYNPTKTTFKNLETAIIEAGYDANDKKADKEAFDNLPECCQIKKDDAADESKKM